MRKVIFELLLLGIAIGLTVEVIKSAIPYLPLIWLLVLAHYTWEALATDRGLALADKLRSRLSTRGIMYSYALAAILGGALFCLYWWGLTSFFAPKIAAYEAEHSKGDATPQKQNDVVKQSEPRPHAPETRPSVTLAAYLQPMQPYSAGTILGGISWLNHYVDVRLDVANGTSPIRDLDFSVQLDTDIASAGQISQFPGITIFPDKDPPAAWLEGFDAGGQPTTIPIVSAPGGMRSAPVYRIHCHEVFANTVVHFVIASMAFNRPAADGRLPKQLFAPRRPPKEIRVRGQYAVQEGQNAKWYPLEFSYEFPQVPALPFPPRLGDESKTQEFAKLHFTFWPVDPKDEKPVDEISLPVVNGVVTVAFSAKNVGNAQADNGQVWIQICDGCKFAEEPEGTTMPPGDPIVRRKRFDALHIGAIQLKLDRG